MNTMRLSLRARTLGVTLVACGFVVPAYADQGKGVSSEASKQSDIGAVTGFAVGAAVAGPVGAVVGAAAGAVLGDRYHRQQKSAAALSADLHQSEAERSRLAQNVAELDTSLAATRAHETRLGETLQHTDEIGLDVGFRTDEDGIPEATLAPLLKLGALAASLPDCMVRIAGYADPRGSDAYNDALSLRRAQAVAAALTSAGVPAGRIILEAHGKSESQSEPGDLDGYAFDRRVTVRLEQAAAAEVARRD
jgi:outer membrane protein OmpA-like peptidoglycan-associated protein